MMGRRKGDQRQPFMEKFFETSVLAGQGNLFFKNGIVGTYGSEKQEAIRAPRPEIHDQVSRARGALPQLHGIGWRSSQREGRGLSADRPSVRFRSRPFSTGA